MPSPPPPPPPPAGSAAGAEGPAGGAAVVEAALELLMVRGGAAGRIPREEVTNHFPGDPQRPAHLYGPALGPQAGRSSGSRRAAGRAAPPAPGWAAPRAPTARRQAAAAASGARGAGRAWLSSRCGPVRAASASWVGGWEGWLGAPLRVPPLSPPAAGRHTHPLFSPRSERSPAIKTAASQVSCWRTDPGSSRLCVLELGLLLGLLERGCRTAGSCSLEGWALWLLWLWRLASLAVTIRGWGSKQGLQRPLQVGQRHIETQY